MPASDHLLRTLAAVAPGTRIVDLGCADGRHAEPLARLGFDVWACDPDPDAVAASRARLASVLGEDEAARRVTTAQLDALGYPDTFADWGVVTSLPDEARVAALTEAARVLRPGAWLWVQTQRPEGLEADAADAGLVVAEEPGRETGGDPTHAIFRRPSDVQ